MQKSYLFISNGNKPTREESESIIPVKLNNFSRWPVEAALARGYKAYMGINRKYADLLNSADGYDITFYNSCTYRSIFAFIDNWHAYKNLCALLKTHPEIEFIHCNTPIGGLMGRICGKLYGVNKVIYTVHGFHFYKGAPLFNRTVLKWVEQFLAHWTDAILTMNKEDFESAKKMKLRNGGKIYKVPGVGVDTKSFEGVCVDRNAVRKSLGLPEDALLAIAMGDIVPRKNYKTAIEAVARANRPNLHYIICGRGSQIEELQQYSEKIGVADQIHFLGFRKDIKELALASDMFLFASLQEGLPRSTMEAMCAGLPCVISKIRGHVDLIEQEQGGLLVEVSDVDGFASAIQRVVDDVEFRKSMGAIAKEKVKAFDIEIVKATIDEIYTDILGC